MDFKEYCKCFTVGCVFYLAFFCETWLPLNQEHLLMSWYYMYINKHIQCLIKIIYANLLKKIN